MSRQQVVVAASVALALGALGASFMLAACGGSASETPPPLEPDPRGFHYAPAQADMNDSDAGDAPRSVVPGTDDDEPKPRSKASSTWGGGSKPGAK